MIRFVLIYALIFINPASRLFAAGGDIKTPERISTTLSIEYDPCVSPNGRLLAYTVESRGDENIWVMDLETMEKRQVTFHTSADYSPAFLGNNKIIFVSRRKNSLGDLYITGTDGSNVEKLIGGPGYHDSPAANYKAKKIAFTKTGTDGATYVHVANSNGDNVIKGPAGMDPSFSATGDSLVFAAVDKIDRSGKIGLYIIADSSMVLFDTGPGVVRNPAFLTDGKRILFEKSQSASGSSKNASERNDSELWILDLSEGKVTGRLFPGYNFSNPAVSENGMIYAENPAGYIDVFSQAGLTEKYPDFEDQIDLCDSLLKFALSREDSLNAAAVSLEAFRYYEVECEDLLFRSTSLFSLIGKEDIALETLENIKPDAGRDLSYGIDLQKAFVLYQKGDREGSNYYITRAIKICTDLMYNSEASDSLVQKAYDRLLEIYFYEESYESGNSVLGEGLTRFYEDRRFSAALHSWRLKYITATFPGDISDLIPLYIEFLDEYELYSTIYDGVVADLIAALARQSPAAALADLENLRINYSWQENLAAAAGLEQAVILAATGRNALALVRLEEILENHGELPAIRFAAFRMMARQLSSFGNRPEAAAAFDSADTYVDYMDSYIKTVEFYREVSNFYSDYGYDHLESDPAAANEMFVAALNFNPGNYMATWGLAKSELINSKRSNKSRYRLAANNSRIAEYVGALRDILSYESFGKKRHLQKAKKQLEIIIEKYPDYIPAYLSAGYTDNMLESESTKELGLYEDAVEKSLIGISLAGEDNYLTRGFYINLGEAYFGLNQFEEAFKYFGLAMESQRTGEDILLKVKYGEAAFHSDSLDIAGKCFEELYGTAAENNDEKLKAYCSLKLGMIRQVSGEFIEAAEYYESAKPYFAAGKDKRTESDILKAQSFCLAAAGDKTSAADFAEAATDLKKHVKYEKNLYDRRVVLSVWPFGIKIPLIKLLPMRYGGSVYPLGFTAAGDNALLMELSGGGNKDKSRLNSERRKIELLESSNEKENSVDLWNNLGRIYFREGSPDSAAISFLNAYKISRDLEEYFGAYVDLLNRADAVLYDPLYSDQRGLEKIRDNALDLIDFILPSYPNARANLRNIAGLAEYRIAILKSAQVELDSNADFGGWYARLDNLSGELKEGLSRSREHFRQALNELPAGEYILLESNLLINSAVIDYLLGDYENVPRTLNDAERLAVLSESNILYARIKALDYFMSYYDRYNNPSDPAEALSIYEGLPPDLNQTCELPFINRIYNEIIKVKIASGDLISSAYLLESLRKYNAVVQMNRFSDRLFNSDLFRTMARRIAEYQVELSNLDARRRRSKLMGTSGLIELKKVEEEILYKRGLYLDLRREAKQENPAAYSSLIFDVLSIQSLMGNIPSGEAFAIPYRSNDTTYLLYGDRDTIFATQYQNVDASNSDKFSAFCELYNTINVVSLEPPGDALASRVKALGLDIKIKRSYSLCDSYEDETGAMRRMDGILLIRCDGSLLSDDDAARLNASVIDLKDLTPETDFKSHGWIIIDGDLNKDGKNALLSDWKRSGGTDISGSGKSLGILDFCTRDNEAFGIIYTRIPRALSSEDMSLIHRAVMYSGASAFIAVRSIDNYENMRNSILEFCKGLDSLTPINSFYQSFGKDDIDPEGDISAYVYYSGADGWSLKNETNKANESFRRYLLSGNQQYLLKDFKQAMKSYKSALDLAERGEIEYNTRISITEKILRISKEMELYEPEISGNYMKYTGIFLAGGKFAEAAGIYQDLAEIKYNSQYYDETLYFAAKCLDIAVANDLKSIEAYCIFLRGKAFLLTGNAAEGQAALFDAFDKFEIAGENKMQADILLTLARMYNKRGDFNKADSVLKRIESDFLSSAGLQLKNEFSIQKSILLSETFRNEEAKRLLLSALNPLDIDLRIAVRLGRIFLYQGFTDSSLVYAKLALRASASRIYRFELAEVYELFGDIYNFSGRAGESSIQYALALEHANGTISEFQKELITYKMLLVDSTNMISRDSLLHELELNSKSEFIMDLCRYQFGILAAGNSDYDRANGYFNSVLSSDNSESFDLLKWRAMYHLGKAGEDRNRLQYLLSADSICTSGMPEPEYLGKLYGLEESRCDLYRHMGELSEIKGDLIRAVDYYERAFAERLSARYFSAGIFDSSENVLIEDMIYQKHTETGNHLIEDRYKILWGQPVSKAETIRRRLPPAMSILRYYQFDSLLISVYMDSDTLTVFRTEKSDLLQRDRYFQSYNTLQKQSKSDSLLESWYRALILPFEDLLEDDEKLNIIPDGVLWNVPFFALKMPEADYLSEMFVMRLYSHLQSEFSGNDLPGASRPVAGLMGYYDADVELVEYIAEPMIPRSDNAKSIYFFDGNLAIFDGIPESDENSILCNVKPLGGTGEIDVALQALLSEKTGFEGFSYELWRISDEGKSNYYWRYLDNSLEGYGLDEAYAKAVSHQFGKYKGLPYYWAGIIYVNLN